MIRYSVVARNELLHHNEFEKVGLTSREATKIAEKAKKKFEYVYVEFDTASGSFGFLNPNGNHALTGINWTTDRT